MKATVVIPTYNAEEFLTDLLTIVFNQKCSFKYEVLIIDSGSSDNTIEIISKFPKVQLYKIPNSEFGHGKTRNLAAKLAKGEIVVYLTQDAVPAHNQWLEFMIEPFALSDLVYCVFGKQIPRPTCVAPIKREVSGVFERLGPDHSLMVHRERSLVSEAKIKPPLTFFSDVNSAVRRVYLLEKIPFKDVAYSEDQALGVDVLKAGYLKIYAPNGSVFHSHNYSAKKYFHRKYDEYVGIKDTIGHVSRPSLLHMIFTSIKMSLADFRFIARDKQYSLKRKLFNYSVSPFYNLGLQIAIRLATNEKIVPDKLSLEAKTRKSNKIKK